MKQEWVYGNPEVFPILIKIYKKTLGLSKVKSEKYQPKKITCELIPTPTWEDFDAMSYAIGGARWTIEEVVRLVVIHWNFYNKKYGQIITEEDISWREKRTKSFDIYEVEFSFEVFE